MWDSYTVVGEKLKQRWGKKKIQRRCVLSLMRNFRSKKLDLCWFNHCIFVDFLSQGEDESVLV